jgi:hypothetical protein
MLKDSRLICSGIYERVAFSLGYTTVERWILKEE